MVDTEPPAMKAGSTLRFRVEDPMRGIESSTWSIVGSKKSGDLYVSGREIMGDLKLSLHESGITRMAWTAAAAASRVAPDADRVFSRWTGVDSLPNGWALVLRLSIPDSALSPILPSLPERPRKPTVTLPAAGPGRTVEVRVLLAKPGAGGIRLEGELEEVGRMMLGDGTKVFVTAWSYPTTPATEAQLSEVRAHALAEGAAERPVPRAFAWGHDNDSSIPFVLDAGDPRPPEQAARHPSVRRTLNGRCLRGPASTIGWAIAGPVTSGDAAASVDARFCPRAQVPTAGVGGST